MNHPQCCNAAPLMNTGPTDWAVHALLRSLIALENRIQLSSTLSLQRNNNLCLPLKNFSSPSPHLRDTHGTPPNPPLPPDWPWSLTSEPVLFVGLTPAVSITQIWRYSCLVLIIFIWAAPLHQTHILQLSSCWYGEHWRYNIYFLLYIHVQYISIYIWIYLYLYIHVRPWAYYICARNVLHMNKQYMYIHKHINI